MKIDRALQRTILERLAGVYPSGVDDFDTDESLSEVDADAILVNVQYLAEHGLVNSGFVPAVGLSSDGVWLHTTVTCITAQGIDFISDDGGLGAILNTITVRLDATQWAELLAKKIETLPGVSPEERSSIAKSLRSLPAKALEKVSEKLLDWAVDHAADALPLLRMLTSQVPGLSA